MAVELVPRNPRTPAVKKIPGRINDKYLDIS